MVICKLSLPPFIFSTSSAVDSLFSLSLGRIIFFLLYSVDLPAIAFVPLFLGFLFVSGTSCPLRTLFLLVSPFRIRPFWGTWVARVVIQGPGVEPCVLGLLALQRERGRESLKQAQAQCRALRRARFHDTEILT